MSPLDTMTDLGGHTAEATRLVWIVASAIGAGLLSSVGELEHAMQHAAWRAWDLDAIATTEYGTSDYQRDLFVAPSFGALVDDIGAWLRES